MKKYIDKIIAVVILILAPLLTIWSLNSLFNKQIPINLNTWAAMSWLIILFNSIKLNVTRR